MCVAIAAAAIAGAGAGGPEGVWLTPLLKLLLLMLLLLLLLLLFTLLLDGQLVVASKSNSWVSLKVTAANPLDGIT
jgi:hypothetical protein